MRVDIRLGGGRDYGVFIDELFSSARSEKLSFKNRVAIVSNETVAPLYLEELKGLINAPQITSVVIKDGEKYKNLATIEQILRELFVAKLDRKSTLIALGGGVVSDMVGFAASIYERGIDFINIPTTLLSQIDASVGGKTGVNNEFGKNLVGSFHQPRAVFCESRFLASLPVREFAAGMAEAVKMAVAFDAEFFDRLEEYSHDFAKNYSRVGAGNNAAVVGEALASEPWVAAVIARCVELKAAVVIEDEKESGVRAALNFGHTFGHVIEATEGYGAVLHGEAVAMGMVMANRLAVRLGLLDEGEAARVREVLGRFGLPTAYEVRDRAAFYESFGLDKKSENGDVKFILAHHIGRHKIMGGIDKNEVMGIL